MRTNESRSPLYAPILMINTDDIDDVNDSNKNRYNKFPKNISTRITGLSRLTVEPMHEAKIRIAPEQIRILYSQSVIAILGLITAGSFLAAILFGTVSALRIAAFLGALLIVGLIRLVLYVLYRRRQPDSDSLRFWGRMLLATIFLQGCVWGFAGLIFSFHTALIYQLIILLWIVGVSGATVSIYAINLRSALSFIVPALLPLAIYYLTLSHFFYNMMGAIVLLYVVVLFLALFQVNRSLENALRSKARLQNEIDERKSAEIKLQIAKQEIEQTSKELEHVNNELASIIENLPDVFYRTDITGNLTRMSSAGGTVFGFTESEVLGTKMAEHYANPDERNRFLSELEKNNGHVRDFQAIIKHKNGTDVWVSTNAQFYKNNEGDISGVEGMVRDITEQKRLENMLREISLKDGLTNLANRRHFDNAIADEWKRSIRNKNRIALFLLDIDYFKQYNDTYGHIKGDEALKKVSSIIANIVNRPGDLAARYGGEELAIIMPGTTSETALEIAENIRKKVQDAGIPHSGSAIEASVLTISIGVAVMQPDLLSDYHSLIHDADEALYRAKNNGRNCVEAGRL